MLPPTFISDPDIRIYYVCGKCTLEIDSKFIEYMERESELKLRKLQSRQFCDVCEFKKVLEELRYQFHESHVNVIDVKAELAIIIGAEDALERTSNELLNEKIQYCRETASIFHLIIPCEFLFHIYFICDCSGSSFYFSIFYNCYSFYSRARRSRNNSFSSVFGSPGI